MQSNKQFKKTEKQKNKPFLLTTVAIAVAVVAIITFIPKGNQGNSPADETKTTSNTTSNTTENTASTDDSGVKATLNSDGDVVIQIADITEKATFYEYDSNGTPMGLFAVKASDGTIRTALNTCQVCNGSPNAYFKQQGDKFQCQNCGNIYSLDMIGQERGGCNPVPIMADNKTVTDSEIIIPATFLDDNAAIFANWKKF